MDPLGLAPDKALQDCLDHAAADHTRALAALSAGLTASLLTRLAAGTTVGGATGAVVGVATLGRFGGLRGLALGSFLAVTTTVAWHAEVTIPQAQAAINDAYMKRVMKCILAPPKQPGNQGGKGGVSAEEQDELLRTPFQMSYGSGVTFGDSYSGSCPFGDCGPPPPPCPACPPPTLKRR